ncbi:MAG: hydantoinase/carbamoylase family amidase [Anaerolineales bacterium]
MNKDFRIDAERMRTAFDQLAQIGSTGDGGVNRPSLSEAHLAARAWFRAQIKSAGLEFRTDGAGNHSAFLACGPQGAPTLLLGSHLDSVVNGGRFDGALGVMAAFEVLRTVKEAGIQLDVNLEAIDFTDEEGTLVGLLGSGALAGNLDAAVLENPRGGRESLSQGMQRAGLTEAGLLGAARPKDSLAGYLEVHIEQGKRLERRGTDIGVVSAIVGIWSYRLSFMGRADHAGSTTMEDRRDASLGASAFTLAAREIVLRDFPNCVVNIGRMDFSPGAFNIVPARVDVALEFRSPQPAEFDRLNSVLLGRANEAAGRFGLDVKVEDLGRHEPCPMDEDFRDAITRACDHLKLSYASLPSGAGHDGQSLAGLCPVGMIFVPSVDGASHSAREHTDWQDCINGANVLLHTVLEIGA